MPLFALASASMRREREVKEKGGRIGQLDGLYRNLSKICVMSSSMRDERETHLQGRQM